MPIRPEPGLGARPMALRPRAAARDVWQVLGPREDARATNRREIEGMARRDRPLARLEALLMLTREPITSRRLAQWSGLADGTEARTLVRRLNRFYVQRGTAFRVEEVAGGYQLLTRPALGRWLRRQRAEPETRLTPPALETLAVVAYRQPVLRAEIESIRGVQCGEILRTLMERGLVRIVDRANELGRPFRYGTTRAFLQHFGLRHLDELPRASERRHPHSNVTTPDSPGEPNQLAKYSAT